MPQLKKPVSVPPRRSGFDVSDGESEAPKGAHNAFVYVPIDAGAQGQRSWESWTVFCLELCLFLDFMGRNIVYLCNACRTLHLCD